MSFTELTTTQLVSLAGEQQEELVTKQQEKILNEAAATGLPTVIDLVEGPKVAEDPKVEDPKVTTSGSGSESSEGEEEVEVVDLKNLKRKRENASNASTSRREKRIKEMSEENRQRVFDLERIMKEAEDAQRLRRSEMKSLMQNPKLSEEERQQSRAERNLRRRQNKALVSTPLDEDLVQLFLKHNIDVSVKEVELVKGEKRSILHYNSSPVSPSMKSNTTLKHLIVAVLDALHGEELHTAWLECGVDKEVGTAFKTLIKERIALNIVSVQTKESIFKTAAKNFLKLALELETLNRSKHFKGVTMIRELVEEAKKEEVEGGKYQQRLASLDEASICLYTERHDFVFKQVHDDLSLPLPFICMITNLIETNFDRITAAATVSMNTA